jgi:hypothetical protein
MGSDGPGPEMRGADPLMGFTSQEMTMANENDDEKEATMVTALVEVLPAAPVLLADLAAAHGVSPDDRLFRLAVWQSIERYREETGIQLKQCGGEVVPLTPEEQLEAAKKRFATAANRVRRGYEIADGAARRDPSLSRKVERMYAREAGRAAPIAAGELAALERARRDALIAGKKPH